MVFGAKFSLVHDYYVISQENGNIQYLNCFGYIDMNTSEFHGIHLFDELHEHQNDVLVDDS